LLGSWFLIGDILAVRGELRDRAKNPPDPQPLSGPSRFGLYLVALVMGLWLWLSVLQVVASAGQALYVLGLMVLLAIAAAEFLYFINLLLQQGKHE
jgi:hypothetical protein